ncbi:MAG: hypothetical protein B9S32_14880 [Verrucomicrobia bacterium Tous-C9LFEB]|nr:MAG: hypothetical protein B9S32_14880 [Verrucomicrobia bacterium Tous-C9LFEB]
MYSLFQNPVVCGQRDRRSQLRGFTLIEMFVVLSIVAVMASLLLMGFGRAMQLSKMAKSTSNLRAIATSINLYVSDNQGRYPYLCDNTTTGDYTGTSYQGNYWSDLIRPYLLPNQSYVNYSGQKFNQCPTLIDPFMKNGQHHTICDYGGSTEVFRFPWLNVAMRAATVSRASQVVMVVTAGTSVRATWYLDVSSYVNSYASKTNDVNDRGTGEILCVFIDGHTEAIPTAEFVENRRTLLLMNP